MMLIDMPMPKTCGQCFCAMMDLDYNTVRCRFNYDLCFEANSRDYSKRRLDGCPLHEVTDPDTVSRQDVITLVENIENRRLMGEIDLTYAPMLKGVKALPPSPSIKPDAEQPESDKSTS